VIRSKLPADAFTYYTSLGPDRSYAAVASFFKVDKTTVVRRAKVEGWQQRLATLERKAQQNVQSKLETSLTEMNERHLKILRAVLGKAIETLRAQPMRTAADAVRAIEMCVKNERVILGEPSEREAIDIETVIKREYQRWLLPNVGDAPQIGSDPETATASAGAAGDDS
jgi:hypothetical protein